MIVDVQFLGKPKILIDGIPIELEQKKAQALLIYVLYNGSSTRDELAELLWCDYPAEGARRNLRNSLYNMKTVIGKDILVTKGHSFIRVSPDVTLRKDIDLFIMEDSRKQLLSLDSYVFLDRFYLKNCPEFDNWITSIRNVYEKLMVKRFSNELHASIAKRADRRTEICAMRILEIDPYHEEAGRALMQVYMARGDYNTATACYQKLKYRLEEDLSVQPEAETQVLFQRLLELKKRGQTLAFDAEGQRNQLVVDTLNKEYYDFRAGRKARHCILSGDIGMGKSDALQAFLNGVGRGEAVTIKFQRPTREVAYYGVERLTELLTAWSGVKQFKGPQVHWGSSSLYYFKLFEALFVQLEKLGRKGVLVLENMEAIDSASMDIFFACLFEREPRTLFIVGEYCPNFEENSLFWEKVSVLPHFQLLQFPLLDERDSAAYLRERLDQRFDQDEILREGHECTGGNLLLLREFARNISQGTPRPYTLSKEGLQMVDKLLSSLSPEEHRQMEVLSVLELAEVEAVTQIMGMSAISSVQVLDALSKRGWVSEGEANGHLLLHGRFGMIQSLLYERMPRYKRMELHRLAAEYYEEKYRQHPKDLFYLTRLSSHYNHTYDAYKKIYYNVLHLERVLDYYDEFFPTIVDENIQRWGDASISRKEIFQRFRQYNKNLQDLEDDLAPQQYDELRMKLDFLQGRAMIRSGGRDKGLAFIEKLLATARRLNRNDMLLKGYVEALCYTVRSGDTVLMEKYIQLAYQNDDFEKYEKEKGVLFRLHGYLCMLKGEYVEAEKYLEKSIAVFEQPKLRGTNYFNIAGAYAYLSLTSRRQLRLEEALGYIRKAIDLCVKKNVQKSLDVFYEDCGYIFFLMEDYVTAEQYFLQSIDLYEQFDTYWLRSIAESGLAMIYAYREDKARSLEHFRRAEVFSRKEMADEELTVLEQARKELREREIL